jgi:hypothetical protein
MIVKNGSFMYAECIFYIFNLRALLKVLTLMAFGNGRMWGNVYYG